MSMLMSIGDVADALSVSPHSVRRWAAQGKLPKVKLGTRTLFEPEAVAEFVEKAKKASDKQQPEDAR